VSLNRWVFKWRLKVRMFSHSRMSAGREFQVDGKLCMRGTTSVGASEERRARGGAWVCTSSLRYVGVHGCDERGPHLVSQYIQPVYR